MFHPSSIIWKVYYIISYFCLLYSFSHHSQIFSLSFFPVYRTSFSPSFDVGLLAKILWFSFVWIALAFLKDSVTGLKITSWQFFHNTWKMLCHFLYLFFFLCPHITLFMDTKIWILHSFQMSWNILLLLIFCFLFF